MEELGGLQSTVCKDSDRTERLHFQLGTSSWNFVDKEEESRRGDQEPVTGAVCIRKSRTGEGARAL